MKDRDDDIRDELEFHLDAERSEREAEGLSPEAANAAARKHLGNFTLVAEDTRSVWRRAWLDSLLLDLRYAYRALRREPRFSLAAIACLALGIGANTAVFSAVNACLLRALPFAEPDRMVAIYETRPREGVYDNVVSYADFLDWREQARSFSSIAAWEGASFNLTGSGDPRNLRGAVVTADFFSVLGARMAIGRGIETKDETSREAWSVVVTHGFWQRHLSSDPAAAGRFVTLDGRPYAVAGVLPAEFAAPVRAWELFVPMQFDANSRNARGNHSLNVMARLAPGSTLEQARAEMDAISRSLEKEHSAVSRGHFSRVVPIHEALRGNLRPSLGALIGVVAVVLMMACFNVANLLLARSLSRAREVSVRLALGASRARVIRQLLIESLVLALVGAAAGIALALRGVAVLRSMLPEHPSIAPDDIQVDLTTLAYTACIAVASAVVFGLAPAFAATSGTLLEAVRSGGRLLSPGRSRQRQHAAILVAQTALAVMLLTGAGLLLRSFWKVQSVEPGFRPRNLLTMQLTLPVSYRGNERKIDFQERMLERVRSLPGVVAAGFTSFLPFTDANSRMGLVIDGIEPDRSEPRRGNWRVITPGYLEAMQIPLRRGRVFERGDRLEGPLVMLVNETAARRYWPGRDPIGTRARLSGVKEWATVAGVVGDVTHWGLEKSAQPEVYYCALQKPMFLMSLVVRTSAEPEPLMTSVRGALRELDKDIPPLALRTMEDLVAESNSPRRFITVLVTLFASIALLLAAGGIFAQLVYAASRRRQEIGIRLALGARRSDVVACVARTGLLCALAGVAIGIAASVAAGSFIQSMLFKVDALDTVTLAAVPAVMLAVAAIASCFPAWQASGADPASALRLE